MSTYEGNRYAFPASAIASGTLNDARIPSLATSKITSGTFADARLSSSSVTQHVDLTALSASNLTSGTIPNARYGTPTFSGANITNLSTTTVTGNWTPSFSAGSYSNITGKYQKVGQYVFCQFEAQCTANPSISGSNADAHFNMGGLPFTSISYAQGHTSWLVGTGSVFCRGQLSPSGTFEVYVKDNSTGWGLHQDQGYRQTQYFGTTGGYGGLRNYDVRGIKHDSNTNESWLYGKIFYVSAT